jgi:glycosyltransferase involved in cell wall biosynthesis
MNLLLLTEKKLGSYSRIGDLYCKSFESADIEIKQIDYDLLSEPGAEAIWEEGDIVLHNTIGPNFRPVKGAVNVAILHHEWSRYPKRWIENLELFNRVWVTSAHMEKILHDSGFTGRAESLPPALDLDPVTKKENWKSNNPFRFLSLGEAHFRKGFHLLIEGFMQAFPEPGEASLTIKTSSDPGWQSPREDIKFLTEYYSRSRLQELYENADCYVSASLGEGLGLPVAEAILSRLPVATNYWGGHMSLLCDPAEAEGFFPIKFQQIEQPYCSGPDWYAEGQQCAFSSPSSIAETLKTVICSSAEKREETSRLALDYFLPRYTASTTIPNLLRAIDDLRA